MNKLMVFIPIQVAAKPRRRLDGRIKLPKVIEAIKFTNDVDVTDADATSAA